MADEEFDIMKPISPHLDIGKTMFDEPSLGSTSATLDIGKTMFDDPVSDLLTERVGVSTSVEPAYQRSIVVEKVPDAPVLNIQTERGEVPEDTIVSTASQIKAAAEPVREKSIPISQVAANVAPLPAYPRSAMSSVNNIAAHTTSRVAHKDGGRSDLNFGYLTPEEAALLDSDNKPDPVPVSVEQNTGPVQRVEMDSPLERALDHLDDLVDQGDLDKKQTERLMNFRNAVSNNVVPPASIAEARGAGVFERGNSLEREVIRQSENEKNPKGKNTAVKVVAIVFIVFAVIHLLSFIFPFFIFFLSLIFS